MFTTLEAIADDSEFDVVVLGAGAAGLAAALFAALKVRKVLLVERTEYVGGTTAFSAGTTWIPNTQHASAIGADDSVEKAGPISRRDRRQSCACGAAPSVPAQRPGGGRDARGAYGRQVQAISAASGLRAAGKRGDGARPGVGAAAVRWPPARRQPCLHPAADTRVHHPRRHDGRSCRYQPSAEPHQVG